MTLLKNKIPEKIKTLKSKGPLYLLKVLKALLVKKQKSVDIYILDNTIILNENKKSDRLERLRKTYEIKALLGSDTSYFRQYVDLRKDIQLTDNFLMQNLNNGCVVLLALLNTKIIGCLSVAFNEFPLQGGFDLDFMLRANQAYCFHGFVKQEFRGDGIFHILLDSAISLCMRRNRRNIIAAIYNWNTPSIKVCSDFGFKKYATIAISKRFFLREYKFVKDDNTNKKILMLQVPNKKIVTI